MAAAPRHVHVIVPGPLDQRTGGYLYDARMVAGLRKLGWSVDVLNLEGSFPGPDETGRSALAEALASLPDGARVVVDGLAMGGYPEPVRHHGERLRIISLVHHPLADETGLTPDERNHFERSERDALEPCAGVIVTSGFTAERVAGFGVPTAHIRAVPPGTNPAPRAVGPGPGRPPCLISVATITRRKGHDVLVEALGRLRDLPWTCLCEGSTEYDPAWFGEVVELTKRHGVDDRVHFIGEVGPEPLDAHYHASSIFVLASHYEGYGMALTEALARGLPIVSTTGGAIPFTVPADAGILVAPGDAGALTEALRSLLSPSSARRAALADAARRRAETLPTWEGSAEAFAHAIDELTA